MIQIKCQCCNKEWIVHNKSIKEQKVCPFCGVAIVDKAGFDDYSTLDKVIYGAIVKRGIDIIQKPDQLIGFMLDTAPKLKKEIRILARTILSIEEYSPYVNNLFAQNSVDLDNTLLHIRHILIEEEGLSETWADIICDGLSGAAKHYKSGGYHRLVNVQVNKLSQYAFIAAPIDGTIGPLDEFLGNLGWGFSIKPVKKSCILHAPIDGCVDYEIIEGIGTAVFFDSADGKIQLSVIVEGSAKIDSSRLDKMLKKGEPCAECDFSVIQQDNEEIVNGTLMVLLHRASDQEEFYSPIRALKRSGQVKSGDIVFIVDHSLLEIGEELFCDDLDDGLDSLFIV